MRGYRAGLAADGATDLVAALAAVAPEDQGFAYEGAAMALRLLDLLLPWRRTRWSRLLAGPGAAHVYMVHVGAGLAAARLRRGVRPSLAVMDPLLRWLELDGYGFHQGYFHWPRFVAGRETPRGLDGYALRAFDQGLGRSLWFVSGGDPVHAADWIRKFPKPRHGDLWSGIGLACAYAGGVERGALLLVARDAGEHVPALRQGVAFAAAARQRAGNPAPPTELAAQALCAQSAASLAALTMVLSDTPSDAVEPPAYEVWRRRIQERLGGRPEPPP